MASRPELESLLAGRGFGRTVNTFQERHALPCGSELATLFESGPAPATITELVAESGTSSGLSSAALALCARACRDATEAIAWVDATHAFDPAGAAASGVALERLLWVSWPRKRMIARGWRPPARDATPSWVRGAAGRASAETSAGVALETSAEPSGNAATGLVHVASLARSLAASVAVGRRDLLPGSRDGDVATALEVSLMLARSGAFRLVVLDLNIEAARARTIPRATWFRLLRAVEWARKTSIVVLSPAPLTGTCAALVAGLRRERTNFECVEPSAAGTSDTPRRPMLAPLLSSVRVTARVLHSRRANRDLARASGPLTLQVLA